MQKKAIITGITGQDGAYLSKFLLENGYEVTGLIRSYSNSDMKKLEYLKIREAVKIVECDVSDFSQLISVLHGEKADELYNLAAQSSVSLSFAQPIGTLKFNITSVLNILESIRIVNPAMRFYQASSSEMYGKVEQLPIRENSPFHPLSPYAISKASAHWIAVNYREAYSIFTACGVLFNHESYLRSPNFFVKKVIRESIEIYQKKRKTLKVGNIEIRRDFGYAPEYVKAMWLMLQAEQPDDYFVCSGSSVSLRSIILHIFDRLSIPEECIEISQEFFRPAEIKDIYGDNSKARQVLNWNYNLDFFQVLDKLLEEELLALA